jgi:2-methylcitrate dehydratase PrpD
MDGVAQGLGARWEIMKNTYKPYPCGVVLNPVIEACLALHARVRGMLAEVEAIELTGHPLLRERTDRPAPRSGREAQVSAQHAVAVCLQQGRAGLDEFSDACVADPTWRALGAKVRFVDDARYGIEAARVTLKLQSGDVLSHHVEAARGSLDAPLTDEDLTHKLRTLAAWGGSGRDPGPLIEALWSLDSADDASALMPLAAGHA